MHVLYVCVAIYTQKSYMDITGLASSGETLCMFYNIWHMTNTSVLKHHYKDTKHCDHHVHACATRVMFTHARADDLHETTRAPQEPAAQLAYLLYALWRTYWVYTRD